MNPLLEKSPHLLGFPQYDKIRPEHFKPAFDELMEKHKAEVDRISNQTEAPTFENTLIALERAGTMLDYVSGIFSNMNYCNTHPTLEKLDVEISPKLSSHSDSIFMNDKLFQRVAVLHKQHQEGTLRLPEPLKNSSISAEEDKAENERLLWRYHRDFVRAGAELSKSDKERLSELNSQLSELTTKFQQTVQAETTRASVGFEAKEDLEGLSEEEIAAAKHASDEEHEKLAATGLKIERCYFYTIKMRNTSQQPCLAKLKKRASREKILKASLARGSSGGKNDTREIIVQVAKKRDEKAKLLGYRDFASLVAADEMIRVPEKAHDLTRRVSGPAIYNAVKELEEIRALLVEQNEISSESEFGAVDVEFGKALLEKKSKEKEKEQEKEETKTSSSASDNNSNNNNVSSYLPLDRVLTHGIFAMIEKLYGVTFKENSSLPVYHSSIRVFEVYDKERLLGIIMFDLIERPEKNQGGCCCCLRQQFKFSETEEQRPIVHISCSFHYARHVSSPSSSSTSSTSASSSSSQAPIVLLQPEQVTILAHEGGHSLHNLFSDVRYPRLSCTKVPNDFVEFPSKIHEFFICFPEMVRNYACHYSQPEQKEEKEEEEEEEVPQFVIDKVASRFFPTKTFGGPRKVDLTFETVETVKSHALDQGWHTEQHSIQLKQEQEQQEESNSNNYDFEKIEEKFCQHFLDFENEKNRQLIRKAIPPRFRSTYFNHIICWMYPAMYHAYIFSEVLDADTVSWFFEEFNNKNQNNNKKGEKEPDWKLTRELGDRLRKIVLSKGGSVDPAVMIRDFLGRDPSVDPMLRRRGIL